MTHRKTIAVAILGVSSLMLAHGDAEARIVCDGNFQIVKGHAISTPYCREMHLAQVARTYGFRVSDQAVRYSESTKAQVCRAIGYDNRVQEICAPFRPDGGSRRVF